MGVETVSAQQNQPRQFSNQCIVAGPASVYSPPDHKSRTSMVAGRSEL